MKFRRRPGLRGVAGLTTFFAVAAVLILGGTSFANVNGAGFTTDDPQGPADYNGPCLNGNPGHTDPAVNCNIYTSKQDVWINGGPTGGQNELTPGDYFFAVLQPGGQPDPNDAGAKNLSDTTLTPWTSSDPAANSDGTTRPAGDLYTNRTFHVDASGHISAYTGSPGGHVTDSVNGGDRGVLINLWPYDDTPNPGGVYILAICQVPTDPSTGDGAPGVSPRDCKYDAFKVKSAAEIPPAASLSITKGAVASFNAKYSWQIGKDVNSTRVEQSGTGYTFQYTVNVSHDPGTPSGWTVTGDITVDNFNEFDVSGLQIDDSINDANASCVVNGGSNTGLSVPKLDNGVPGELTVPYTCTYSGGGPSSNDEVNTATVSWPATAGNFPSSSDDDLAAGNANFIMPFSFPSEPSETTDECVDVTDNVAGDLGVACVGGDNPTSFSYDRPVTGVAGTCTSFDNTATFTTNDTGGSDSAGKTVSLCVGKDLTASKSATPTFKRTYSWSIAKAVDKTLVEQIGGTATFNYTVNVNQTGVADSEWKLTGSITLTNSNDWEDISASVGDSDGAGGTCTVYDASNNPVTSVNVPHSGSVSLHYACAYPVSGPSPTSGTNTATATWDKNLYSTPTDTASGTATFAFSTPTLVNHTITVKDTFNGVTTTLGTLTGTDAAPFASASYHYSHGIAVPASNCIRKTNTAVIFETSQSASQTVEVCGPARTGALTMGFWQNKNGQKIITGGSATGGICNSGAWLRVYAPFQDLSATATCAQVASYVSGIIGAANCGGANCNAMLKAQMLATALDVYFGGGPGGNPINAPVVMGNVAIDLTKICRMIDGSGGSASCSGTFQNASSAFGGATSKTVSEMLAYAASQSNAGGSYWYGQIKATQVLAKDAFDAINNQVAFSP